jgi:hypothetical protein
MTTTYLNEKTARRRTADLGRRTRRAQRPALHPATTPRGGIVLTFGWLARRSQVIPALPA